MPHYPKPFFRKPCQTWYVEIDGHQHNLGKDEKLAFERYHDLMRQEKPREVDCSLVVGVLGWVRNNKKPKTYEWYQRHLQVFVKAVPPQLAVGQIKKHHLTACIEALPGWSSTTKNDLCRAVIRAFQWAEDEELIQRTPLRRFKKPRSKRREVVIPQDEFDAMMTHFPSRPIIELLTFAWEVGPRPQGLVAIEARHVAFVNERVVFPTEESKGQKMPRVLYLTDKSVGILQRLVAEYPAGVLFRNTDGDPWTKQSLACVFGRLQVAQGLKVMKTLNLGPTALPRFKRHAFADKETLAAARKAQGAKLYARRKELDKLARTHAKKYSLYHFRHAWATRALQRGVAPLTVAILMGTRTPPRSRRSTPTSLTTRSTCGSPSGRLQAEVTQLELHGGGGFRKSDLPALQILRDGLGRDENLPPSEADPLVPEFLGGAEGVDARCGQAGVGYGFLNRYRLGHDSLSAAVCPIRLSQVPPQSTALQPRSPGRPSGKLHVNLQPLAFQAYPLGRPLARPHVAPVRGCRSVD